MRPKSIERFEQLYLGALAIGAVNTFLFWDGIKAQMFADPNIAKVIAIDPGMTGVFSGLLVFGLAFAFAISLLLWYLAARRRVRIAMWIIVIFFGFSALSVLMSLARNGLFFNLSWALSIGGLLLNAGAVWMLFRPDSKLWFEGERNADEAAPPLE